MSIVEFLLARIAEDEAVAREAIADDEKVARAPGTMPRPGLRTSELEVCDDYTWGATGMVEIHPARVLAECQAKRAIIELHASVLPAASGFLKRAYCVHDEQPQPCPTLRALAAVYADHPDFDPAWRP